MEVNTLQLNSEIFAREKGLRGSWKLPTTLRIIELQKEKTKQS